jgi:hypothetical protein
MKQFKNINPSELDNDSRCIFRFVEYVESIARERFFYLLLDGDLLIWARKGIRQIDNQISISGYTEIEFPKTGLSWFIDTIENKFLKTESEGGLKREKFSYEEEVEGERLCISRMFGTSGYAFRNYSRKDYVTTLYDSPQQASFSDELLFEKGLFAQLKTIAEKLTRGS